VDFKRLLLIAGASMCVLVAYTVTNVALDRVACWVEVKQDGYLWWREEWMQLFGTNNFVNRGRGRILLTGSSEVREGFLFDEFEAELQGFEVYNNAFSNHTLQTLIVVLQYIETAYGPSAMPQKIVLGVTPLFLLDEPSINRSYLPRVIDRYSPLVSLDIGSRPARLVRKGWLDSLVARYRYLTHQSQRYKGALRGVMRAGVLSVAPGLADDYRLRLRLVPSIYHHLPPADKKERLHALRRILPSPPAPVALAASVRTQWTMLQELMADHNIDLYVVNMPQSTFMQDDYYAETYDGYEQLLRSVVGNVPFLDLARFLRDDEFYDITHANLAAARRISRRVAQFVRETEAAGHRSVRPRDPDPIVHALPQGEFLR
jgi:hypothetical protein